jgi:hypothetical protein
MTTPKTQIHGHPLTQIHDHPLTQIHDHPLTQIHDHPLTQIQDHPPTQIKDHDIWHWKSRSWLEIGTQMWCTSNRLMGSQPTIPLLIIGSPTTIQTKTNMY